ncbi:MAG: hypothetical protein A3G34_04195 [Candidatus Lindowbacteria bacterium RIFCSPLOWO2_12_FULL_62_27]|nr:MAG: hypothetical protein A3G34_04195 [Candidatus Lindowbacteria bacterium RIFCSPLOWO2_12_FULL_62_27]OGH63506.1 MAG: hypothetical protein A3I06_13550 [Candidatus Lindowbacteria bacterium RIFCSPLOWO2_02_FULL_62_12]
MVLFGMIVAMLLGATVLFWRNGFTVEGMFENHWRKTLQSNAEYYPAVGKGTLPAAEVDPSWSTEGY